jgi:phage-related protein
VTSRNYDIILTVSNAFSFTTGNILIGNTSQTVGIIAGKDTTKNLLKVKLANLLQEFSVGETVHSNIITITGTANGAINNAAALPFYSNTMSGNITTATATVSFTAPSSFIAEKNAFTQNPIVRLYSIYYPGEWYPPNENGNPSGVGEGRAWPADFPIRIAEIVGDLADDISYNITYGGTSYAPYPISISGIEQTSEGRINDLSVTLFNVDNFISRLVEDPYLAGNNVSNAVVAHVNGELVHGIDPRTVNVTPEQAAVIDGEMFATLTRARANGLFFSEDVVSQYGRQNATFTYGQTQAVNGIWEADKEDSRDLLGAIVDIKTTFANFLDYWPEYSLITAATPDVITVRNSTTYRIGDTVYTPKSNTKARITSIDLNNNIYLSNELASVESVASIIGDPLYIVNQLADTESYVEDRFKIDHLESLSDHVATFGLVSWLQYFKIVAPKRKYYKNTCQWVYKGSECQYPGPGGLPIPGTNLLSNASPIAANNEVSTKDVCSKSFAACGVRNNQIHFGGFYGVGRTVPRA